MMCPIDSDTGLSPRVRGSHFGISRGCQSARSIPASAGQPTSNGAVSGRKEVYPRECGAAAIISQIAPKSNGLSPRVRGSLPFVPSRQAQGGSIPASAGQPSDWGSCSWMLGVYPRECGAARAYGQYGKRVFGLSPRVRGSLACESCRCRHSRSIPASAGQPLSGSSSCAHR